MTERNKTAKPIEKVAQILSDIFSPIMIPTYMMAIAMWMTPLIALPERPRFVALGVIALLTAFSPTAAIFTLIKMGKAHDVSLSDRRERTTPYIITIICYLLAMVYLRIAHAPIWLADFYLGAAVTSFIATLITFRWKISAHTSAVGGFCAAILWLALHRLLLVGPLLWVSGAFLLVGLIGTSRLILSRHTLSQVAAGFLLGFATMFIILTL